MDSQSFGILLIILVFACGAMIAILQYSKTKESEIKFKKDIESVFTDLERKQTKNQKDSPKKINKPVGIVVSKRHSSHPYQYKHNSTIKEIIRINSKNETDFIFLDTETSSLDNPHIIDIAIISISGSVLLSSKIIYKGVISEQAQVVHGISTANNPCLPFPIDLEDDLLNILKGKTIVAYNAEFDLKALKTTFTSPQMVSLIHELEDNSICMMKAFQELFRLYKRKSLVSACEHLGIERLPAHNAKNDVLMLHLLYKQLKPLFPLSENWMLGFEDIHWESLNLSDGTELSYWSSRDKERQALYRPGSAMGSGKVAELSDKLKSDLEKFGEVSFVISSKYGVPDIVMSTLSYKEAKENHTFDSQQYHDDYINQILNPKMSTKGKLRLNLTLDCREANCKRIPPLTENETYRPYVKEGDVLTIPSLLFTANFNFKDVHFVDSTGQSCGHLSNVSKSWTRVLGILMKGYRAEVHVIDTSKRLKVDVFFIKPK